MIKHFSELMVWQKADVLAHQVFDLTETFPRRYLVDLTSQLRRELLTVPQQEAMTAAYEDIHRMLNGLSRSLVRTTT